MYRQKIYPLDDDMTLKANREGFSHYQLRTRRLVDTTSIDMSVDLFGTKWDTPIVLAGRRRFPPWDRPSLRLQLDRVAA